MKIAMICNELYQHRPSWVNTSDRLKKAYCEKWGWDCLLLEENPHPDLHPVWSKPRVLLDRIDDYDWLVWMDADAMPVNMNVDIAGWLEEISTMNDDKSDDKYDGKGMTEKKSVSVIEDESTDKTEKSVKKSRKSTKKSEKVDKNDEKYDGNNSPSYHCHSFRHRINTVKSTTYEEYDGNDAIFSFKNEKINKKNDQKEVEILRHSPSYSKIVCSTDILGLNFGVFAVPCNEFGKAFLEELESHCHDEKYQRRFKEQQCVMDMIAEHPDWLLEPPRSIGWNTYLNIYGRAEEPNRYFDGAWCIHLPGIKNETLREIYVNQIEAML